MDFIPTDEIPKVTFRRASSKYVEVYNKLHASGKQAVKTVCDSRERAQSVANSARFAIRNHGLRAKIMLRDKEVYLVDLDYKYPQK